MEREASDEVLSTVFDTSAEAIVSETLAETEEMTEIVEEISEEELFEEENSEEQTTEEESTEREKISIIVNSGERSGDVGYRLHSEGLIDDPDEFDLFMMQNGYDKKIRSGEHFIPVGAGLEEIAEILMQP